MRSIPIFLLATGVFTAGFAAAQVPSPPPRPAAPETSVARATPMPQPRQEAPPTSARIPPPLPARPIQAGDVPLPGTEGAPCTELLASQIADVEITASMSGESGGAFCGDEAPVRISAIRLADAARVELRPAALVRCDAAHIFARWVREDLAPAARQAGGKLKRLEIAASYSCRPRNNVTGARLSEHALANAIDVSAVELADGRRFAIGDEQVPSVLIAEMRRTACARFTTVLGPGADAAHADHVHVDLARRRSGYRLCQWNMPDWPMP